ncbi:ArnT family glycosyltransferase [Algoriphagus antarcticus]|uniref:Dolichyl-phosphate-mannose-protein mannosyltransferase n=1 Tax=Algoriphagus antarcticus TaxID=238540 RepID=A0A3E0E158_9BACT|nr:glycosyltransferase family 39 protein [Algoriphagus antarcticus]REG91941.1 dolichyl-phosphate-mannose-protein mannosyltransferase [Algoriphagus antarcticus]
MQKSPNYTLYFWLVTIGLVIAKILFTLRPEIDLFTEEAQYWLWSQNMAWHYYSKPPLVAVLNYLSTAVLGNTEIGVRINAILMGVGISWVTFVFGSYLYGKRVGFWSAMILNAMPVWWLASTFHMTDSSLTFFWILSVYLAYRGITEHKVFWWILAGLATALAVMAKVVAILIFPVLLLFLFYTASWKIHRRNFLLFALVSLVGFVPALIWNWQNDFDTFKHLAALGGSGSKSFSPVNSFKWFLEYWSGQLAIISVFLLPAWFFAFRAIFKTKDNTSIYLILPGLLTFIAFAGLSLMKRVEVNWPIFAYSGFAIVLGQWIVAQSKGWIRLRNWGIGLSIGIPLVFLLPDFTFLKSIEPIKKGEQKALSRMLGHEMLANRIDFLRDSLRLEKEFFFSDSYHTASEMSFFLADKPQTYVLNMGSRKNQFDLWDDMSQFVNGENIGVFVSWSHESLEDRARFEKLIYEETYTPIYQDLPIRKVKIQIWENLQLFEPYVPITY